MKITRACCLALALAAAAAAADTVNVLPEGDFEAGALPEFWHRMGDYTRTARPAWRLDAQTAHSGKASAVGDSTAEYVMMTEISPAGPVVVEGFLKAERDAAECQVRVGWHVNWNPVSETRILKVGRDWTPFRIEVVTDGGKIGRGGTVAEVGFLPKSPGRFWLDDVRLGPAKGAMNAPRKRAAGPAAFDADVVAERPERAKAGRSGEVKLRLLDAPPLPVAVPVRVGVPLPQGEVYHPGRVSVLTAAKAALPAQTRALSHWLADGSVQALLVEFWLPPGTREAPTLRYGPDARQAAETVETPLTPRPAQTPLDEAIGLARPEVRLALGGGLAVARDEETTQLIARGPVSAGFLKRGSFQRPDGGHAGSYELWVTACAAPAGPAAAAAVDWTDLEFVFVNDAESFVNDLEAITLALDLPRGPGPVKYLAGLPDDAVLECRTPPSIRQTASQGKFLLDVSAGGAAAPKEGRAPGWVVADTGGPRSWAVMVRDFWWKHPRAIRATDKGVEVDLWPAGGRGLRLSRGVAPSLHVTLLRGRPDDLVAVCKAFSADPEPLVVAEAAAFCRSGVFGVALTREQSPFPFFEATLAAMSPITAYSRDEKLRSGRHGLFDYGDGPGDGGWANAETMLDHAFYQWFFRTGERAYHDAARALARHFRDIDVEHPSGEIKAHCMNHTMSGGSPSHSWIQGLCDDYLLTGSLRTLRVLRESGRWLAAIDPKPQTGRDFTRLMDNLTDLYLFTGDAAFRDKALEYAAETGRRQDPARQMTGGEAKSWFEHRYTAGTAFVWYGTYALAKLHNAMPTDELRRVFLTELDLSLNTAERLPYILKRYPEYKGRFPDKPGPDYPAEQIGYWAKGRGAVVWPSLAYAHQITGDRKYLDLGFRALGHYSMGMSPDTAIFATPFMEKLMQAGYGAEQERKMMEGIAQSLAAQYPRGLPDPGFETEGLAGWALANQQGKVESSRDTEVKLAGASSLRIRNLDRYSKPCCTATYFCDAPGRYRVRVYFKREKGVTAGLAVNFHQFLPPKGQSCYAIWGKPHPDNPEWSSQEALVDAPAPGTVTVLLYNIRAAGSVWYDEVQVERIGDVPPPAPTALVNGGFEDEKLAGWRVSAPWMGDYGPDRSRARQGKQSLKVTAQDQRDAYVTQDLQLKPGRRYSLTAFVSAAEGGEPLAEVRAGGVTARAAAQRKADAADAWTAHAATFETPADGRVAISLHNTAGRGAVWYDAVEVREEK